MMSGSNRNSFMIKNCSDVVWVYTIQGKRQDTCLDWCLAKNLHVFFRVRPFSCVVDQLMLVRGDAIGAQRCHIIHGSTQTNSPGDMRCSCFKFVRQIVVGRFIKTDCFDHVTPTLPWRHVFE